ncbi:MAG: dolichyl-phosphate beta-glucosyltransferase [Desulfobacterales bacterium]
MDISVIIPAYNEEDRIGQTLRHTFSYLSRQDYQSEVVVVSDGSDDNTADIARHLGYRRKHVSLKIYEYHPNRGKGYAVRLGMLKGCGTILMFMDADYSVPIENMEKGRRLIRDGCDIAIGSRAVRDSRVIEHQNMLRELSARFYTSVQNHHLGIGYKDTQCGFKFFKKEAAKDLFGKQKLNSVIFDPEILWLAKQAGYRVKEFPVTWRHVENSRIRYDSIKKFLSVFQELFRIKKLHRISDAANRP